MGAYSWAKLAATANVVTGPHMVQRVVLTGGSDAATAILYDATTGTTNEILKVCAAANTTVAVDLGGIALSVGVRVAITGTAPVCTVVYR